VAIENLFDANKEMTGVPWLQKGFLVQPTNEERWHNVNCSDNYASKLKETLTITPTTPVWAKAGQGGGQVTDWFGHTL